MTNIIRFPGTRRPKPAGPEMVIVPLCGSQVNLLLAMTREFAPHFRDKHHALLVGAFCGHVQYRVETGEWAPGDVVELSCNPEMFIAVLAFVNDLDRAERPNLTHAARLIIDLIQSAALSAYEVCGEREPA